MISTQLGCHKSTVSREIRRRSWSPERDRANLRPYLRNKLDTRMPRRHMYSAHRAHSHAARKKRLSNEANRMVYGPLLNRVVTRFRGGLASAEIQGRLRLDCPVDSRMRVSHETIYAWMCSPPVAHRELWEYLPRVHRKRCKRGGWVFTRARLCGDFSFHAGPRE